MAKKEGDPGLALSLEYSWSEVRSLGTPKKWV